MGPTPGTIHATFGTEPRFGTESRQDLAFASASPESLERLKAVLNQANVGVRLVLAGPSADILAARSTATECGMIEEEMTLLHEGTGHHCVFCAHCRATTAVSGAAGNEIACSGCATVLSVSGHFSRRLAAYLGYAANAEEAA
jgi:dimethylamine monooxygenase subunit C